MGGVIRSDFGKARVLARSTTTLAASATSNIIPIWSTLGYGTTRIFVESDVAGTINFQQRERNGTFRTTDSYAVAAATGTSAEFSITGEYGRWQYVNGGTIQTRFAFLATLVP